MKVKISPQLNPVKLSAIESLLTKPKLVVDLKKGRYILFPSSTGVVPLKFSTIEDNQPFEKLTPKIASIIFDPLESLFAKLSSKEGKIVHIVSQFNNILKTKKESVLDEYPHLAEFLSASEDGSYYVDPQKVTEFVDTKIIPIIQGIKGDYEKFIPWLFREYVSGRIEANYLLDGNQGEISEILRKFSYALKHKIVDDNKYYDLNRVSFTEVLNLIEELEEYNQIPTSYYLDVFLKEHPERLVVTEGGYRVIMFENPENDFEVYVLNKLSGTHWCTNKYSEAKKYLEGGRLYMVLKGSEPRILFSVATWELHNIENKPLSLKEIFRYRKVLDALLEKLQTLDNHDYTTLLNAISEISRNHVIDVVETIFETLKEITKSYTKDSSGEFVQHLMEEIEKFISPAKISEILENIEDYPDVRGAIEKETRRIVGINVFALWLRNKLPKQVFDAIFPFVFVHEGVNFSREKHWLHHNHIARDILKVTELDSRFEKIHRKEYGHDQYSSWSPLKRVMRLLEIVGRGSIIKEGKVPKSLVEALKVTVGMLENLIRTYRKIFFSRLDEPPKVPEQLFIPVAIPKSTFNSSTSFPLRDVLSKALEESLLSVDCVISLFERVLPALDYLSEKYSHDIEMEFKESLNNEVKVSDGVVRIAYVPESVVSSVRVYDRSLEELGFVYDSSDNSLVLDLRNLLERAKEVRSKEEYDEEEIRTAVDVFVEILDVETLFSKVIGEITERMVRLVTRSLSKLAVDKIEAEVFDVYLVPAESLKNALSEVEVFIRSDNILERITGKIFSAWIEGIYQYTVNNSKKLIKEIESYFDAFPNFLKYMRELIQKYEETLKEVKSYLSKGKYFYFLAAREINRKLMYQGTHGLLEGPVLAPMNTLFSLVDDGTYFKFFR